MTLVALCFLVLLSASVSAHAFQKCSKHPVDLLGVKSVDFTPDPPKAGSALTVTVTGVSGKRITSGTVKVGVYLFGVEVGHETLDLCQTVTCPMEENAAFSSVISQDIPSETPDHTSATVRVTVLDQSGEIVTCLESSVSIYSPHVLAKAEGNSIEQIKHVGEFLYQKWKNQFKTAAHGTLEVFVNNWRKVASHNTAEPRHSFSMALNELAGLTEEEFVHTRMGYRADANKPASHDHREPIHMLRGSVAASDPPAELDWTAKGAVTPVKNQGSCGSCWAFSAVAAIESAFFLKSGLLAEFSEQELVSCDNVDYGCQGGLMDNAFEWVKEQGGLCGEEAYPYTSGTTSARGVCQKAACTPVAGTVPSSFIDIAPSESALLAALAAHGPVSVAIEADQTVFQFYHKGVLTGACGTHLDHGVLLVGYGIDIESGTPFWKVKNSWGTTWGEDGYVRMQRGKRWPAGGECGIASKASFPVL